MNWEERPAWTFLRSVSRSSVADAKVLSLHKGVGVVVKGSVEGNYNRTPENLGRYQAVRRGDVVVNRMKAWQGTSGVSGLDGIISAHYLVFEPTSTVHNLRYLDHLLRSELMRQRYEKASIGIRTGQWELSRGAFAELPVPVPPLEAQRRIADHLDTETARIDTLIAKTTEAAALVDERFQRLVVSQVAGPSGAERGYSHPWAGGSAYPVAPYSLYGRTGSGHTPSRSVDAYWVDCDIPWITTRDVAPLRSGFVEDIRDTKERISSSGMANSAATLHPAGTVVLSRTASVGFAGVMAQPMATSQDFFTWTPDRRLDSHFLLWSLRAMKFAGRFDQLMYGSTHKTIYVPDLVPLRGPVPPLGVQERAVTEIRQSRDLTQSTLHRLEDQERLLRERRHALVTAAVTGDIEV